MKAFPDEDDEDYNQGFLVKENIQNKPNTQPELKAFPDDNDSDSNKGVPVKENVQVKPKHEPMMKAFPDEDNDDHEDQTNEIEAAEKSVEEILVKSEEKQSPGNIEKIDYDMLLEKIPGVENIEHSEELSENDPARRFPTLSDEDQDQDINEIDVLDGHISPAKSDEEIEELKAEDLNVKDPASSIKKRNDAETELLKISRENREIVEPFEFSQDSNSDQGNPKYFSIDFDPNSSEILEHFMAANVSIMSKSKSEDWGGKCFRDYNGSDEGIQPIKLHYTEGDLSNIELVEDDSEGEESENTAQNEMDDDFAGHIEIAQ